MATKKSGKGGRPKAGAKTTARARTTKPAPKKNATARGAKPVKVATKPAAKPASAKRPLAKPTRTVKPGAESADLTALKARFQRERNALEKRLTEAVREIGMLRHHELRAEHLANQLRDRDETVARLQRQLAEAERRPAEPVYEREVQQSFALATPPSEIDELVVDDPLADDELS
jgi:hypothetical protein